MYKFKYSKREYPKYDTIKEYFEFSYRSNPSKIAYVDLKDDSSISFEDFRNNCIYARYSLNQLLKKNSVKCCVISENSIAYMNSYFSIIFSNNVAVLIAGDLDEETLAYQIDHTDCEVAFVSKKYLDKVNSVKDKCKDIKHIILLDEDTNEEYQTLNDLIRNGNNEKAIKEYEDFKVDENKACLILFTSGTSGYNKAVQLSNRNICCSVYTVLMKFGNFNTTLSVLPFYHSYENCCHVLPSLFCGCTNYINDSASHVMRNFKKVPAEVTVVVPTILDTIANKIRAEAKRLHSEKYLKMGIKTSNTLRMIGIDMREKWFKAVLSRMSDSLRTFVVGGAAINPENYDLLTSIGLTIINGYGETECSPLIACNSIERQDRIAVGKVIEDMEVKIDNKDANGNGEILVRGKGVMLGYYKDKKATNETIDSDGWLHTGDLGHFNRRKELVITGRSKNLIILANGKNVYPEELEFLLSKHIRYIKEVIVHTNDKQSGLYASAYLDEDFTINKSDDEIYKKLKFDIAKFNKKMPSYKYIIDVNIKKEPFKKNINKKIVRKRINSDY